MRVHEALDADGVRLWAENALAALANCRSEIDSLNVYPVPDGDTGTNLYLTLEAGAAAVAAALDEPVAASDGLDRLAIAAAALSRGTLIGARGNSGVILSQYLRGVVDELAEAVSARAVPPGRVLANALERAATSAYAAVARPVEGTMLTVGRAAGEAARRAAQESPAGLSAVARAAAEAAAVALERTPSQLAVLERAGVVDAGGRGLLVMLDALADLLGSSRPRTAARSEVRPVVVPDTSGPAFEVMFLLDADQDAAEGLRDELAESGESVLVVGADRLWNVHVHTDDAGAAVESGIKAGRPFRIRIEALTNRVSMPGKATSQRRLVVVTHGPGVMALAESAGAVAVPAEPNRHPASAELMAAIEAAGCPEVVLLPSDADTRSPAEAAAAQARAAGLRVAVIPTRSVVQSLAALAVHDPSATFEDDVVSMTNAAGATRYAAVTVARHAVMTSAGVASAGSVMGLVDGDIVELGDSFESVALAVAERLLSGAGELVTLVRGASADEQLAATVAGKLRARHPGVEVSNIDGGQPLWPLIIGVE